MAELRQTFRPEFLNRLDEIVFYKPLTKDDIRKIVDLQIKDLNRRLSDRQISCEVTDAAKDFIVENGYDPVYGARPLKRFIQKACGNPNCPQDDLRRSHAEHCACG